MTPCQKLLKQEGTARRIKSMQQSSATPKNQRCREGVAEDCCMLSILLAVHWPGTHAAELEVGVYYYACAIRPKWRLIHPETLVELSVSLFDSLAEFICSKGPSSVGYRVDWCKNNCLQSNQFVGRRDEEEEEKDGENRG